MDTAPAVRAAAARLGARLRGQETETVLFYLLHDHHPAVWYQALQALNRRGAAVEERLQHHLMSGPAATRYWGAQALAKLQLPGAAAFLPAALFDQDPLVVTAAATGLLLLPEPDLPALILDVMASATAAQRAAIIRGLAASLYAYEPAWFTLAREADPALHERVRGRLAQFRAAGLAAFLVEQLLCPGHREEERCLALLNAMGIVRTRQALEQIAADTAGGPGLRSAACEALLYLNGP